jgi:hypothetical protein
VSSRLRTLKLPACLGTAESFFKCPSGFEVFADVDAEISCKTARVNMQRGDFPRRNGPSLWVNREKPTLVSEAKRFINHKKDGREFGFNEDGTIHHIYDWKNDDYHGMYLICHPNGRPSDLQFRKSGDLEGMTRHWREDGTLTSLTEYVHDEAKRSIHDFSPADKKRFAEPPPDLCKPKVCDVNAEPQMQ